MRATLVVLTACALSGACTVTDGADTTRSVADSPAALSDTVTLRGTVRLAGTTTPVQPMIENTTDPQVCGSLQPAGDLVVDTASRGIANVVVALRDVPGDAVPAVQPSRLLIDNRDCQFVPRVAVLTVGSTIEATSHDDTLHTVHFYGALERNIALPDSSASRELTVGEPGMIAVLCDVHGWMKAYIRVDAHPYHAVTDSRGAFEIGSVPRGSYQLDVWHERLGSQSLPVLAGGEGGDALEISYALDPVAAAFEPAPSPGSIGLARNR